MVLPADLNAKPGKRLLIQMLSGIMISLLWVTLIRFSANYLFFHRRLIIFSDEAMLLILAIILISLLTLAEFGVALNENYRKSLAEVERFRKENAEYQFEMLKLQLNPHFLFNSLNTLGSLVYEDPEKASEFVRRLSYVYRYVLDNRSKELVMLREEMEFIRAFSFLQGLRFQGMIEFRFDINEEALNRKVAPMTMQLFIENAVKHNVVSARSPLQIDNVKESIKWLNTHSQPDLIFLDIQLAEGLSFEIFRQVNVTSPVIFTTAYDEYAIKVFQLNSIDYLLKPVRLESLEGALRKLETLRSVLSEYHTDHRFVARKYTRKCGAIPGRQFQRLDPGSRYWMFTIGPDGKYYIEVPRTGWEDIEYKVTRGNWYNVECDENGDDIDNRMLGGKAGEEVRIKIVRWKDKD
jgi:CheY-like chemotaxis protein